MNSGAHLAVAGDRARRRAPRAPPPRRARRSDRRRYAGRRRARAACRTRSRSESGDSGSRRNGARLPPPAGTPGAAGASSARLRGTRLADRALRRCSTCSAPSARFATRELRVQRRRPDAAARSRCARRASRPSRRSSRRWRRSAGRRSAMANWLSDFMQRSRLAHGRGCLRASATGDPHRAPAPPPAPSRRPRHRRARADALDLLAAADAEAGAHRHAARRRARGRDSAITSSGTATLLAGRAGHGDGVHEALAGRRTAAARRCGSVTGVTICTSASSLRASAARNSRLSSSGRSGTMKPATPAARAPPAPAPEPEGEQRIQIAHEQQRRARRRAAPSSSARIQLRLTPCASAARLARWMVTPSAIGSVNGTPISTTSAAAASARRCSRKLLARREAGGQIGDQRRLAAARRRARIARADALARTHGALLPASSVCCSVDMSLSPRPERHTRMRALADARRAQRSAPASACALSSAGRMPSHSLSCLHRLRAPPHRSRSRSARARSACSSACSGPTPG